VAIHDSGTKRRFVGVEHVVLAHIHVGEVPRRLRAVVHGIVLGRRDHAVVLRVFALHAGHKGHTQPRGQKRVLAGGLLSASSTGIAKDVDVGRPEI